MRPDTSPRPALLAPEDAGRWRVGGARSAPVAAALACQFQLARAEQWESSAHGYMLAGLSEPQAYEAAADECVSARRFKAAAAAHLQAAERYT
ncbi:hypothetical protein AB870_24645 (plasmid) [Pandoraea faecigallinarum]|uniref:Uncharacterized protein n=1 Tax=Pandoraea faecigallinarum TaxID=656179 RepID=A0A0H3X345_9BURK|nr:hypothetical protein AB870_24645 [Pandoraea faecigallinarum]